jgi:anti-anti-sigma regulatory factor
MITEKPFEQRWTLEGRLCRQWAADLAERWQATRDSRAGLKVTVDLENVVLVDCTGEEVLHQMALDGATLISSRAYMKNILGGLHVDH